MHKHNAIPVCPNDIQTISAAFGNLILIARPFKDKLDYIEQRRFHEAVSIWEDFDKKYLSQTVGG